MGKYYAEDDELRKEYKKYIKYGGNDTTSVGHNLADLAFQRAKERGMSLEDWVNHPSRHPHKNLADSVDEKKAAIAIYKAVSSQGVPLSDTRVLVEHVLREHRYKHISIRGKEIPLSRTRSFLIDYARALLLRYHLPTEPAEYPHIILE